MSRIKLLIVVFPLAALLLVLALFASGRLSRDDVQYYVPWSLAHLLYPAGGDFSDSDATLKQSHWIYDVGITDANDDGLLDIFTTNHNWRQLLLLADGHGGYHDVLTAWGLDQSREFPGVEISAVAPRIERPGLYIYWYNRHLYIRSYGMENTRPISIGLHALTELDIIGNDGFHFDRQESKSIYESLIMDSTLVFSAQGDAILELYPRSRGVPMNFSVDDSVPLEQIYVGNQLISPQAHEFSLPLQDRHAMVWSDFNDDGQPDIFITRGAIGGTVRIYPPVISDKVNEEFFVSRKAQRAGYPSFDNIIARTGIAKKGCSARHANWVDFDRDGLLDIFINCEDVGHVEGEYPNKLYRQQAGQRFIDVARQAGLEILEHNIIDYEWFDADNDGDMDLFTHQDDGFYLYRNTNGRFEAEFIYRGKFARIDEPSLKGASGAYWIFDGKLSVADYDGDGDFDVFAASKKGNALLVNDKGHFASVDPASVGLPADSVSAAWVDYDNDGIIDLHTVPDGIFRQDPKHSFERTNLLVLPSGLYMASIINWYDMDNNGTRDVLIALNENQTLHRWWESARKDTFLWQFLTFRNRDEDKHWLQLRLVGKAGNREAIGARVSVTAAGGRQIQEVGMSEGSFYSQGHYRLYFGLGPQAKADLVTIRWPDGTVQEMRNVEADSLLTVRQEK